LGFLKPAVETQLYDAALFQKLMLVSATGSPCFQKRAIGKSNGKNRRKPNKRGKIKREKFRSAVFICRTEKECLARGVPIEGMLF
jgi:hypothetical protein